MLKKKLVAFFTFLFVFVVASPAMANVNFTINDKPYVPSSTLQLADGITMVPLDMVDKVLGADITVDNDIIIITENSDTLTLTLGSNLAVFNDQQLTLSKAPELVNGEILVPLRSVYEAFGTSVGWQQESKTVSVSYSEQRQGMTADELMLKSTEAMLEYNTYKVNTDMKLSMGIESAPEGTPQSMDMNMVMDMAMQQEPVLIYVKTTVDMPPIEGVSDMPTAMISETFMNQDGMYMTVPGQEGWFKMDLQGLDIQALMEASADANDPIKSMEMMKDFGAIINLGNDQNKEDQEYWVVNITLTPDSFEKLFQSLMGQMPAMYDTGIPEADAMIQTLFDNIQADMTYASWINKSTMITDYMDIAAQVDFNLPPVTIDGVTSNAINMSIQVDAFFEMYDMGEPITFPDVSDAADIQNIMPIEESLQQPL
ncbi:MAG: copper amine oxidase N-terminal domain-containing protein [Syntrophomonadaceae bacterium]|nr:copper amine oxidase N-terminal domain-containing protein [Syntrophomonadaceae bacterium]